MSCEGGFAAAASMMGCQMGMRVSGEMAVDGDEDVRASVRAEAVLSASWPEER